MLDVCQLTGGTKRVCRWRRGIRRPATTAGAARRSGEDAYLAQVSVLTRCAAAWARRHLWGVLLVTALLVSAGMYAGNIAVLRRAAGGEAGRQARAAIASAALEAVAPGSVQARCAAATGVPKVALLLLTRGALPHEGAWRLWFAAAAGEVPLAALRAGGCSAKAFADVAAACSANALAADAIGNQHMFSVYVHTPPDFAGFPPNSLFHGREISAHINATWGDHALVDAAKALVKAALAEPANQKLALLSESDVPLYPPALVYQQLISEPRSRVNACLQDDMSEWRRHPAMSRGWPSFSPRAWRKSSQWFALTHLHAQLFLDDTVVDAVFRRHCYDRWDDELAGLYNCYSDEHQLAIVLALAGRQDETDCTGRLSNVDWTPGGPHPKTFLPSEVTAARLRELRLPEQCDAAAAVTLAERLFVLAGAPADRRPCDAEIAWSLRLLPPDCPLFARKFPANTSSQILSLLSDCSSGLGIVKCFDAVPRPRKNARLNLHQR
ncbi:hypothetical protein WJX81_006609 [Elliptochloris bilobata]|uniref:Nucleotide-diphospho-sugar transferase domain-containing protein n=1 Tax=Elliptochloris bilobata TaxID=381761 RepID=A0AAW1S8F1_9CHLO